MTRSIKTHNDLPQMEEGESWRRAVRHTNAILDMYNETGSVLSADLVTTTLENVVQLSVDNPHKVTQELLEDVESLIWRIRKFDLVPSVRVLESLWDMQVYHRKNRPEKASKEVGRQVNLLTHWREWSSNTQNERARILDSPPESYLVELLEYAVEQRVSMSFTLWELYNTVSSDDNACGRPVYANVLRILAQSPSSWNVRQRRVCNDMIKQSRRKLNEPYWPTPDELRRAMEAAAIAGRAQDAAWLLRTLNAGSETASDQVLQYFRTSFIRALLHCNDPGSMLYMEELLASDQWENDTLEQWKLLLQKLASSQRAGCGTRAEKVFEKIEQKYTEGDKNWMPDLECVSLVVQSYLNEPERSLKHILKATTFVKRCVASYHLHESSNGSNCRIRLFDTLLKSFDDYARTKPEAVIAADDLFRFFLVQHRDGRVSEIPDQYHLGHILRYYNRQYKKPMLHKGAQKSLEYFRLYRTLAQKRIVALPPDLFNVRQLLGTLARSGEAGYGVVANKTLAEALETESLLHPYALGHCHWTVIACLCRDGMVEQALGVLQQWEEAHRTCPERVRLTGAPYQTIIHTLAQRQQQPDKVKLALEVLRRLERQVALGNHRVVVRQKLYKEALRCCESDLHAQEIVHASFRGMNFTVPP